MLAKREEKHRLCLIRDGMRLQNVNSWQKLLKNRVTEDEDTTFGECRLKDRSNLSVCLFNANRLRGAAGISMAVATDKIKADHLSIKGPV